MSHMQSSTVTVASELYIAVPEPNISQKPNAELVPQVFHALIDETLTALDNCTGIRKHNQDNFLHVFRQLIDIHHTPGLSCQQTMEKSQARCFTCRTTSFGIWPCSKDLRCWPSGSQPEKPHYRPKRQTRLSIGSISRAYRAQD
jgi:hypothetical protein